MSHAERVPETYQLTGDDAVTTIKRVRWQHLLAAAFGRLRVADGFSHARASAFALALLLVEGPIALLGLAVALGSSGFSRTVTDVLEAAVPGPAGQLLTSAARQAQEAGSSHRDTAVVIGSSRAWSQEPPLLASSSEPATGSTESSTIDRAYRSTDVL